MSRQNNNNNKKNNPPPYLRPETKYEGCDNQRVNVGRKKETIDFEWGKRL